MKPRTDMTKTKMLQISNHPILGDCYCCPKCRAYSKPMNAKALARRAKGKRFTHEMCHAPKCKVFWDDLHDKRQPIAHSATANIPSLNRIFHGIL